MSEGDEIFFGGVSNVGLVGGSGLVEIDFPEKE